MLRKRVSCTKRAETPPSSLRILLNVYISRRILHRGGGGKKSEAKRTKTRRRSRSGHSVPCRYNSRGRHVTPNIGRKPKLITTDLHSIRNALNPSRVLVSLRSHEQESHGVAHEWFRYRQCIYTTVVHLPVPLRFSSSSSSSAKRVSILAALCFVSRRISASSPGSPWKTRSASDRIKEIRRTKYVRAESRGEGKG